MKATAAQIRWLRDAINRQGLGSGSILNRTALALSNRGLARRKYDSFGLGHWLITEAGRAYIEQLDVMD